jgi:pyruvate formate lyase activating enzyme
LAAMNKPVCIRYVLVPGLTDKFDEIEGLAAFLRELGNIERVDVLPFHKMGEFKWAQAGEKYRLADTPPPSHELLARTRAAFSNQGLIVT